MAELDYPGEVRPQTNVLAARYASTPMRALFMDEAQVFGERGILIEILEAQSEIGAEQGLYVPPEAIQDYESVQSTIDLASIRERELITRHDTNARNQEFNALAGHELIMRGLTTRDLTESFEQYRILRGLDIMLDRSAATLVRVAGRAAEYVDLPMAGRSHNVAAQTITLGKRFSNFGEELLREYENLQTLRASYPMRGIKGPVGTQQDLLDLFGGDAEKVEAFEARITQRLGFMAVMNSVGQVYPRVLDLEVVNALHQLVSGPTNFAKTLRLMAGHELATEGFKPGQVGSNAMPHKMNARTSERMNSLNAIIAGNVVTIGHLVGDQWNEGDVSESAARRVAIPDTFYAADGLFQAAMHILDDFGAYPAVINRELERYLPFLTTTKVLMACVKDGMGRETAHEIIKNYAVAVALEMREQGLVENDLFDRLDADEDLPVTKAELLEAVGNPLDLTGLATTQVARFVAKVEKIIEENPEAATYQPEPLL